MIRYDEALLDKAERPVQLRRQFFGGALSNVRIVYDSLGRVSQQSAPDFGSSPAYYTTIAYDLLSRPVDISRPIDATNPTLQHTTVDYLGLTTETTDAEGKTSKKIFDALGRVHRSLDNAGHYQQFDFDAFGSVRRVSDATDDLLEASYAYGIGAFRLTSDDMDLGAWSYTPNALGEVISHTDAKNQTFTATFDKLSRQLTRVETEGTTTWTWGASAAAHNIGRLASVSSPGHSQSYGYDSAGRLTHHQRIGGGTHDFDYVYNATTGLLDSVQYPLSTGTFRLKVLQEYDHGLLKRIKRSDGPQTVFWEAIARDAIGNVIDEDYGSGLSSVRGFDAVTGRLDYLQSSKDSTTYQDLEYAWDKVGNLTRRKDLRRSLTEDFVYDSLHRLDYSQLNGTTNLDLSYDSRGNILTKSDVSASTWSYHASKKHAVITAGSNSFAYDANGNMSTRNGNTITWASYNYPTQIVDGSRTFDYSYDAHRAKWKQVVTVGSTSETTYFAGPTFEKNVHATDTEYRHYIQADGKTVALWIQRTNASNYHRYVVYDHQGSVNEVMQSGGSDLNYLSESFTAYGERRNPITWSGGISSGDRAKIAITSDMGYTGHLNMEESSLVHMNGRVFDAEIGRALSADPYIPDPGDTQSFNRYSYVMNNPLTFTDPSGFCVADRVCLRDWMYRSASERTRRENLILSGDERRVGPDSAEGRPPGSTARGPSSPANPPGAGDFASASANARWGKANSAAVNEIYSDVANRPMLSSKTEQSQSGQPDNESPLALTGSPQEWLGNDNLHNYLHDYTVCGTQQAFCSVGFARNLFENGLRYHPAPGMAGDFQVNTGNESRAIAMGIDLGPVRFFVNRSAMAIKNETIAGHKLHPGWVRRQLIFENNRLILRTTGQGIGDLGTINELFKNQIWSDANADVFWRMMTIGRDQ